VGGSERGKIVRMAVSLMQQSMATIKLEQANSENAGRENFFRRSGRSLQCTPAPTHNLADRQRQNFTAALEFESGCGELPLPGREVQRSKVSQSKENKFLVLVLLILAGVASLAVICGTGVLLAIPAIQQSREAQRRQEASDNLRQIGRALQNYHQSYSGDGRSDGALPNVELDVDDGSLNNGNQNRTESSRHDRKEP
jgi:hypothetical protein